MERGVHRHQFQSAYKLYSDESRCKSLPSYPITLALDGSDTLNLQEEKESKRTQGAIDDERRYMVDAAVVRIMKARKEMLFERLKNETIEALKAHWNPNVDFIKRRIDALVEQDYIERDENDRKKYIYVA